MAPGQSTTPWPMTPTSTSTGDPVRVVIREAGKPDREVTQ